MDNAGKQPDLPVRKKGIIILIIVLGGLFIPFLVLSFTVKAPPLTFPTKTRTPIDDFCGVCFVNDFFDEPNGTVEQIGVNWTRREFSWGGIETANDVWDWSYWDGFLNDTEKYGIQVLAVLAYDNDAVETVNSSYDRYIHPNDIPYFLDYVNQTMRRYKDRVAAWEIWNEPNLARFWDGPKDHFYELFDQTQQFIHQLEGELSQNLTLLNSAMASAVAGFVPLETEAMFQRGIMTYIDVYSFHYYTYDPDSLYQNIMQQMALGQKYGFEGEYWITEIGNPTNGQYPWRVSQEKLAENIIKSYVISSSYDVKRVIWYRGQDYQNPDPENSEHWFGLLYTNGTWKPAAYAYSLFSHHCSHSILYEDLIIKEGGISAGDLMAALYRRANGNSTLIMWYDPTIYASGSIEVTLDLGAVGDIKIHDIYTGTNQTLSDTSIMVGNTPVFITFQAAGISNPITLHVKESITAITLYVILLGVLIGSIGLAVVIRKK
ncbi:MAG: hypothetical protein HWN65_11785 [Candidatus Helarchaeota archaeon]|nr:hypothetical protein [Candidatus Helarchaeota archaeon]